MLPHSEVRESPWGAFQCRNIYVVGPQPSELIPSFVQHLDVCIMPYMVDEYTKYIYPLKLHEYSGQR